MDPLLLLLLLQIKHWIADFKIQTYAQTVRKGIYGDLIGLSHTMDHMYLTILFLVLFNAFHPIGPLYITLATILEGIAHYHIDWVKVHYGTKDITTPAFWCQFGLDQLAHQCCYLLMALALFM